MTRAYRPRQRSKKYWAMRAANFKEGLSTFARCERCGAILLNPLSIRNHLGNVCEPIIKPLKQ